MNAELLILVIVFSLAGAALGTFSGLVPGIHVNTLAAMLLISYPLLNDSLTHYVPYEYVPVMIASYIVSAAVVHSFVDFVPSVFLGAPDPDEVMNILPGHRMLMDGKGMEAVRSAAIGSVVGTAVAVAASVPMQFLISWGMREYLDGISLAVLISVVIILLLSERGCGIVIASALIILSGVLGYLCMFICPEPEGILPAGNMLFPLLTGLFGMPAMILSLRNGDIPQQRDADIPPVDHVPGIKGAVTGCAVGWFPGITATAGAVIAGMFFPEDDPKRFISLVASIGSASSVFALVTLSMTGNGRTGAVLAVGEVLGGSISGAGNAVFLLMLLSVAVASFLGYHITIASGKVLSRIMRGRDMRSVNKMVIIAVCVLVFLMTGPVGIAVLLASAVLGFVPTAANIGRVHLTGCLIIPVILARLGI